MSDINLDEMRKPIFEHWDRLNARFDNYPVFSSEDSFYIDNNLDSLTNEEILRLCIITTKSRIFSLKSESESNEKGRLVERLKHLENLTSMKIGHA